MSIEVGHINILETSSVTVTSAATGFEATRLYDRFLGRNWKATSTASQTIQADQGATGAKEIDTLVIPTGHNLLGTTLYWEYSDNGADWSNWVSSWTGTAGQIVKQGTAATHRYSRLRITGASAAPYMGECFMTKMVTFTALALSDYRKIQRSNRTRSESISGVASYLRRGERRRSRAFAINGILSADETLLLAWEQDWDAYGPFFFEDADAVQYFAELGADIEWMDAGRSDYRNARVTVLEVL